MNRNQWLILLCGFFGVFIVVYALLTVLDAP